MRLSLYRSKSLVTEDRIYLFAHSAAVVLSAEHFCTVDTNGDRSYTWDENSVLDLFDKAVSKNTVPTAKAPDDMATPSAITRLLHHWTARQRTWKSSLVFTHRPKCPRAKRYLSQVFVIQFPENWIQICTVGTNGSQIIPFKIICFGLCTIGFIRTDP